jgi:hypothetical protein
LYDPELRIAAEPGQLVRWRIVGRRLFWRRFLWWRLLRRRIVGRWQFGWRLFGRRLFGRRQGRWWICGRRRFDVGVSDLGRTRRRRRCDPDAR